ncbi:MAG: formylglycine-generating enzyme family protein [Sedimenticola sp.]
MRQRCPELGQLRALRHIIPDACLHDELLAYNHETIERDGPWLRLEQSALENRLRRYEDDVSIELKRDVEGLQRAWGTFFHPWVAEVERLQCELRQRPDPKNYPNLFRMANEWRDGDHEGSDQVGSSEQQLRALIPVAALLNDSPVRDSWHEWLQVTQSVAIQSGEKLPMHQEGLGLLANRDQVHSLVQIHDRIAIGQDAHVTLWDAPGDAYCANTGRELARGLPDRPQQLNIVTGGDRWCLGTVTRPTWADRIWRDRSGLFVGHEQGLLMQYREASPQHPVAQWQVIDNPWPWANDLGIDDHGLWAEIRVAQATQRLRWIPPGEFMMGSPVDEKGRFDNETQHKVTLSQGYWLGETSCTRAFWHAVMGGETEGDPALPVNQISWDSTRDFFEQLKEHLPGLAWGLPSEAQWEYACRARTETAYWWGDEMDEKYANSSSIKPEAAMPPNTFGLHSMSGNLYEWCADWMDDYPAGPVVDPTGPDQGHERVLRGGSWFSSGRFLRSATRYGIEPGERNDSFGLRLAGGLDPQASQGASGMSADRREWSDRERGAQADGGGAAGEERR